MLVVVLVVFVQIYIFWMYFLKQESSFSLPQLGHFYFLYIIFCTLNPICWCWNVCKKWNLSTFKFGSISTVDKYSNCICNDSEREIEKKVMRKRWLFVFLCQNCHLKEHRNFVWITACINEEYNLSCCKSSEVDQYLMAMSITKLNCFRQIDLH